MQNKHCTSHSGSYLPTPTVYPALASTIGYPTTRHHHHSKLPTSIILRLKLQSFDTKVARKKYSGPPIRLPSLVEWWDRELGQSDQTKEQLTSETSNLTEDMSSGYVGFREYAKWAEQDGHDTLWAILPTGTDLRLFDAMPYYADHEGTVTRDNMPPAGVHLSCREVGGLICLWKGGDITKGELSKRWPSTFNASGDVHRARRPMGAPFLMENKAGKVVFGVASGHYLLCGSGYAKDAWSKLSDKLKIKRNEYFWWWNNEVGAHLVASDVEAVEGDINDDRGVLPVLNRTRMAELKKDGRFVYADRSATQTKIKGSWGGSPEVKRVWPKPEPLAPAPEMGRKNLDAGDRTNDYPKNGRERPFVLPIRRKTKPVKSTPTTSSSPKVVVNKRTTQGGGKASSHPPKPPARSSHTSKDRPIAKESGLAKRVASEDPEDDRVPPPPPNPSGGKNIQPTANDPYKTNEVRLIRQIQRLDDAGAKMLTLYTQYEAIDDSITASFYEAMKNAIDSMIKEDLSDKDPAEVLNAWKGQLKCAKNGLTNWLNIKVDYGISLEPEVHDVMRSLHGVTAYDLNRTRKNKVLRSDLIKDVSDDYPIDAPDQDRRKALFRRKGCPSYDVNEEFKESSVYNDLINCHLAGYPGVSDNMPNRQLDPHNPNRVEDPSTDDNDVDQEPSSPIVSPSQKDDTEPVRLTQSKTAKEGSTDRRSPSSSHDVSVFCL